MYLETLGELVWVCVGGLYLVLGRILGAREGRGVPGALGELVWVWMDGSLVVLY